MTPSPSPDRLALRRPALLFGAVALAILFIVAVLLASAAVDGFHGLDITAAHGLMAPAAIGALLAALSIGPRLRRGAIRSRGEIITRAAAAFATASCVWPLSFGVAVLLQGDVHAALGALGPALAGLALGAIGGGLGGALAGVIACEPAKAAPTS